MMVKDLLKEIVNELCLKKIAKGIVPEQYPLLRMLHLTCEFKDLLFGLRTE